MLLFPLTSGKEDDLSENCCQMRMKEDFKQQSLFASFIKHPFSFHNALSLSSLGLQLQQYCWPQFSKERSFFPLSHLY